MKFDVTRCVAWLGYWSGIDRLFYLLNRRCKRVLTFHNVFPDSLCLVDNGGGMSVSVSQFKQTLREVRRRYAFSTDLEDPSTATITFDDGFLNQYEIAACVLYEMHLAAVLFVVGDNIDRTDVMAAPAVDLLTLWLAHAPDDAVEEFRRRHCAECVAGQTSRIRFWIDVMRPMYVRDSKDRGRSVVAKCDAVFPFRELLGSLPSEFVRLRLGGISREQLNDLRGRGWLVGWHSKSHYPPSAIPASEKAVEFAAPNEFKAVPMSYPYGELRSVGQEDVRYCREAGFPAAYSNLPEDNHQIGRYFRMRFAVSSDKIMLHFHLSGFRHFLKHRKLLPVGTGEGEEA